MIRSCFFMAVLCLAVSLSGVQAQTVPTEPPTIRFAEMFGDRFEPGPLELFPRIEFISDRNAYFEGSGQQHAVGVRVYDANGDLVPSPSLQWTSGDPGLLSVSAQTGGAVLESTGNWQGAIDFTVSETTLGVSARGQVIMADIQPAVVQVPSEWVFSIFGDRTSEHQVTLLSNATTDALVVGDIVLSGDYAGVAVRVTDVMADSGGNVQVTGTPAPITDIFLNYQQQVTGQPLRVRVQADDTRTRVTVESVPDGALLYDRINPRASVLDLLECDGNLEKDVNVDFSLMTIEWSITPTGDIGLTNGTIQSFEFGATGDLSVNAQVSLNLSSSLSLSGQCEADLSSINLGGIFVSGIMISPAVTPGINLSAAASAEANVGWVPFSGLQRTWTLDAGMRYTNPTGWAPYADYTASGSEAEATGLTVDAELGLALAANAELAADLRFCAGVCTDFTELAKVTLIEASGGPYYEIGIATPIDVADPAYAGPQAVAGVKAVATAGAEVSFFSGGVFEYIDVNAAVSDALSITIFDEDFPFLDSEVSGDIGCDPSCVAVPESGSTLEVNLAKETTSTGTATFWVDDPAKSGLTQVASAPFSSGQATAVVDTTGLKLMPGDYAIFGRLALDGAAYWFDNLLPMAPAGAIGNFSVCSDLECPVGDDLIRSHLVGTWDMVSDNVYRSDGPYADNDSSGCHYPQAENVYFENYFYPNGNTVNVYAASPEHKEVNVTLNEDGTAIWRFYNIDTENWIPAERYCPVLLDPPERWDYNVTWTVSNGRVSIGYVRGYLTSDRLKEAYGLDDWDFATGTLDVTDRWRLTKVSD